MTPIVPQATILLIDDDPQFLDIARWMLEDSGYHVMTAFDYDQAVGRILEKKPDVILLDHQLNDEDGITLIPKLKNRTSSVPIILVTAHSNIDLAIKAVRAGAYDYLEKPLDQTRLYTTIINALEQHHLLDQLPTTHGKTPHGFEGMVGQSTAMQTVYAMINNVAPTDANVMISGESGTGKELVARAIHNLSPRKAGLFVAINMASLPGELVESTLFGHEKGAFTGADKTRIGACEEASRGTLFLDEITEMPIELQPKLLRFLQERVYRRVGADHDVTANTRIVTATNRDPLQAVREGKLREDLYYRLNVVPIKLPTLRQRSGDIPFLISFAITHYAKLYKKPFKQISDEALQIFINYNWPGNIRQLMHCIEQIVILNDSITVECQHIPQEIIDGSSSVSTEGAGVHKNGLHAASHTTPLFSASSVLPTTSESPAVPPAPLTSESTFKTPQVQEDDIVSQFKNQAVPFQSDHIYPLAELEKLAIEHAIAVCDGSLTTAAQKLSISPATIYRKIKQYHLNENRNVA